MTTQIIPPQRKKAALTTVIILLGTINPLLNCNKARKQAGYLGLRWLEEILALTMMPGKITGSGSILIILG